MNNNEILNSIFDSNMCESIMDFARKISCICDADKFIVMSRKASCFINFLKRQGTISFNGDLVTDRILDIDIEQFAGKDVVIIDDVVVSGTTIYSLIKKLKCVNVKRIRVYVLAVNKEFYNPNLFIYETPNGTVQNYIQAPYIPVSDAACTRICSNIVSTFALDLSPYDVDFPKHEFKSISEKKFEQIVFSPDWRSYDVSSDLQSQNEIKNITLLPTERINNIFDEAIGLPVSKLGFFKIRLFAKLNNKKQHYIVNAIPFFLFNEITVKDINYMYEQWFDSKLGNNIPDAAKVRILQYVLAEKLFKIWNNSICSIFKENITWQIDKSAFNLIFPKEHFQSFIEVIDSTKKIQGNIETLSIADDFEYRDVAFESKISTPHDQHDNMAVLQTKLIEPFTNLYFTKEKESRELVLKHGEKAFDTIEYKNIIERLKHGYSYHMLINLLKDFPDIYDKITTVSLFVDEAIDAGIIVPIIAEEKNDNIGTFYFRAYRHGEDVPFGELQEKLSAILLDSYSKEGGQKILSKLRVEKMLVLFIKIGMKQGIFKPSPQDSIYYNVNVDSYLHGNVATVQDTTSKRSYHYLKHRTDAIWLSDVLHDKGIIHIKDGVIESVNDNIDIAIDRQTKAKVSAIGQTFAMLYNNSEAKTSPFVTDDDLVLFSTCITPQDILNALAAELAIFVDRWKSSKNTLNRLLINNPNEISREFGKKDIYTSINSGQLKFFNFINKKAQERIDEISKQLWESSQYRIFGTHWDQFWSDNRNWEEKSVDGQVFNTIMSEGKYILLFNILCRMLFLYTSDTKNEKETEKWISQIEDYQSKLKNSIFSQYQKEFSKIIEFSDNIINEKKNNNSFELTTATKICHAISYYVDYIPSILADVELLVDRHGKPCRITRYTCAIHLNVPEEKFALVRSTFDSFFSSKNIEYRIFPIAEPTNVFPETGVWFFVKGASVSYINKLIKTCVRNKAESFSLKYVKIYYNLSENLRLKVNDNCNSKQHFGSFSSYASCFKDYTSYGNSIIPLYWILENSHANSTVINEIEQVENVCFDFIKHDVKNFETANSSYSTIITNKLSTTVDKYRKEYKLMQKKCEVFVSYSEDSQELVSKIELIVERLQREDFIVYFYRNTPLGTDMIDFMRKIETCDIALIIGTPSYKDKAYNNNNSGVSFEDRILSEVYMSNQREKIIPIAFGDFKDSFPTPFNKLKGMSMTEPTKDELDTLVSGLINRYKVNCNKKS